MKKRIILIVISLLLLGGIVYFSDVSKVISTISKANLSIIFLILFTWFLGIFLRSWRWWLLLRKSDSYVPFNQIVKVYIPGLFLSNITPAKTGDPIRSILLKQTNNISMGKSISSIIIERILDVISVIFLALFISPLILTQFSNFLIWFALAISIYLFGIGFAIFLFSSESRTKKFMHLFYSIFIFIPFVKKSKKKINNFALILSKSFSKFHSIRILITAFILTLIIWGMEGFVAYLAFLSIGIKISLLIVVSTMALSTLIGVLSFLPGGIGSAELVFILIFTNMFSLTITQVTSVALIARIPFLMYAVVGAIFLSLLKYKFKIL